MCKGIQGDGEEGGEDKGGKGKEKSSELMKCYEKRRRRN